MQKKSTNNNDVNDTALEWLVKLQSPEVTPEQEQAFFLWLEANTEHQQAYINAEKYWQQLDIVEGFRAANDDKSGRWFAHPVMKSFIAASVLFCAVLLSLQFSDSWNTQDYRTIAGERRHLVLKDGSKITINTASNLRVKAMDGSELRKVYLDKGEALFKVSSDKSRPFIVETPSGSVRVLGTTFTVSAEAGKMRVTVTEGRVALLDNKANAELPVGQLEAKVTLVANQQLTMAEAIEGIAPITVDAQALSLWQEGRLIYQGVSLDKVVADLSRYIDGEIRLADSDMNQTKVVAVFDIADKDSIIKALESALNVSAVSQTNKLTLLYPSKI
jgi:transmembrane sensor